MKRILSIILCVAMLASMASMTVLGVEYGTQSDKVTTENVMTFTTDKETYAPGDTVSITVAMDSIWGDPTLEDYIEGYEDYVMSGAYGMNILCSTLIYDKTVFTAKSHTNLMANSTIKNADVTTVSGNNPIEAKTNGAYYLMAVTESFNSNYDGYGFMTGSGDLWQYNLTIAADAAPGTYYLPVGPYVITDYEVGAAQGKHPAIKFADDSEGRLWAWLGNVDSYFVDQPVTYKTNYTGGSRVASDSPKGAQYECSYVVITIEGDAPIDPPVPPVEEEPTVELISDKAGTALVAGDKVTLNMNINNNEGLSSADVDISFNNTALKLVDVTSTVADFGTADVNYDDANKFNSFDKKDELKTTYAIFSTTGNFTDDGTVVSVTFEVLATAEGGDTNVSVSFAENGLAAEAAVTVSGDHKHSFTETTTPATCKAAGKVEQICSCGLTYKTADMSKLDCNPDMNNPIVVPASCERDGQIAYNCTVCGKLAKNEIKPALGHDWKTVTTEVSCTTDASSQDVCQREGCGKTTELVVTKPALKHIDPATGKEAWGEPYIVAQPTTNAVGYWGKDCALCGDVYKYEEIAILEVMLGDCNMDGEINVKDVSLLLKSIAKWDNLYFSKENADVAGDGRVNAMDVSRLMKYIAKWEGVILGEPPTSV